MNKKSIVRLSDEERGVCQQMIKQLQGASQKFRRAPILLKADADGPGGSDVKIAEAFNCRGQTIEPVRKRLGTGGVDRALNGQTRQEPSTLPKRDGEAEAQGMAMRLGKPPVGYGHGTLRLLAKALVALEVVASIRHETVRQTPKKMA